MKVVILAGGMGTRLQEETSVKPKPMVEIGGYPILWHIMNIYASYGHTEFIIALGYKSEVIKNYFLNYQFINNDISIDLQSGSVTVHHNRNVNWKIHLIDTGLSTETGGRIKRLTPFINNEPFMLTYGDGVANVDISALEAFHHQHGKLATVTAVRPPARFGRLDFEGDRVLGFAEKPQVGEGWINGGFFVLEPQTLDYIENDGTFWEHTPMNRLTDEGQLCAYRHNGFWQCMDTMRDVRYLESLWSENRAPWKVW